MGCNGSIRIITSIILKQKIMEFKIMAKKKEKKEDKVVFDLENSIDQ